MEYYHFTITIIPGYVEERCCKCSSVMLRNRQIKTTFPVVGVLLKRGKRSPPVNISGDFCWFLSTELAKANMEMSSRDSSNLLYRGFLEYLTKWLERIKITAGRGKYGSPAGTFLLSMYLTVERCLSRETLKAFPLYTIFLGQPLRQLRYPKYICSRMYYNKIWKKFVNIRDLYSADI